MLREAASRLLSKTGLLDAKPDHRPETAPAVADQHRSASEDTEQKMPEREQDFMQSGEMPAADVQPGEQQPEYRHDYFDFAPEPSPETEGVERPEGEDDPALYEPVLDALRNVHDPEIPVNIVELGLIYELVVKKGGLVYVEMTLTTPACPVAQSMPGEVENAVASVPGVSDVRVKLVWTPPWDRDRMSEEAKLELGLL
jgi:FeS assembly SUF system protein